MNKYIAILLLIPANIMAAETKITSSEIGTISSIHWSDGTVQVSSPSASGGTTYTADNVTLQLVGTEFSAKSASVTLQGNTFNGNSQLVKLDETGKLPAIDGSQLNNLPGVPDNITVSTITTKNVEYTAATAYSGTSATPDCNYNIFFATATGGTLTINKPIGTASKGKRFIIRIKDDGTARSLTWDSIYRAGVTALPATTTQGKNMYVGFIYNSYDNKWDAIAYADGY